VVSRKSGGTKRATAESLAAGQNPASGAGALHKKPAARRDALARTAAPTSVREDNASARYATTRGGAQSRSRTPVQAPAQNEDSATRGATLAQQLAQVAAQSDSGHVRRKNMNIDQGLLDSVIAASGVATETEAVRLGLAAYVEMAAFERAMLTGFDRWSSRSGFSPANEATIDTAAFLARSARAAKADVR
jgi:hypothetical protein